TAASMAGSASIASRPTTRGDRADTANPGSSSAIPAMSPAPSRAMGPTGPRPPVVFRPAPPQHAAGIRIAPPVSDPYATSASPLPTATAEPLDDPPGTRAGSRGLAGVPKALLIPLMPKASS